jgi:hypothetical protein
MGVARPGMGHTAHVEEVKDISTLDELIGERTIAAWGSCGKERKNRWRSTSSYEGWGCALFSTGWHGALSAISHRPQTNHGSHFSLDKSHSESGVTSA